MALPELRDTPRRSQSMSDLSVLAIIRHFELEMASSTAFVSSSLFSRPRFLICPTLGVFSLGLIASALRYACCSAFVLANCNVQITLASSAKQDARRLMEIGR